MDKILTWIRHNTPLTIGLVICIGLSVWCFSCESRAPSVLNSGQMVTRAQLQIEAKQLLDIHETNLQRLELSEAEIARQDAIKERIFEFGAAAAQSGQLNPLGLIGIAGYVLGIGSFVNGRKKDTIIARDKTMLKGDAE